MKTHRLAMVGCDALAQMAHLPNTVQNPRLDLIATCDIDPETSEVYCEMYGDKRSETDCCRIIDADDIDLIVLTTHTNLRSDLILFALEAGKRYIRRSHWEPTGKI